MQAVVFDFDGVLADSEHLHDLALREICTPLGFTWSGDAWIGWPDADVFRELFRRRGEDLDEERLARLLEAKSGVVIKQVRDGLYRPYPGIIELVQSLAPTLPIGVCSAGLREQVLPVLEQFGVRERLSCVVTFEDTPRSKPDPAPYLLAAERLGVAPASALAIEDSPAGVASAHAAGFRVLALGHTNPRDALRTAHHFVPSARALTSAVLRSFFEAQEDSD